MAGGMGEEARRSQDRYSTHRREKARRKTKGNGVNPALGRPIYRGGPPNLSVAVPSTVQYASTALSRKLHAKIQADFLLRPKSEFRSSAKKTTSGRPDGISFCKPPLHINIGLSTKYMTEESEHYMDYPRVHSCLRPHWIQNPKVHKSPATSLDPEPDTKNKHTTWSGPPRAVTMTYFAGAEYIVRLLLAPGP
jgi:hypothetical protein